MKYMKSRTHARMIAAAGSAASAASVSHRATVAKRTDTQACHHHPGTTRHGYWLLLILFLCGPLGTLLFFVLLPPDTHSTDETGPYELGTKIVHLALAGSSRRARYVLDEYTVWGTFLAGVRDRLQCGPIRTVTDSSGEAILAVADMVDHDHIVIHADWSGGLGEAQASDGGGSTLVRDRRSGSDGLLRLGNSTRRRHRARSLPKLIEQVDALQAQGSRRGVSPEGSPELTPVEPCGARHPTFRLAMVVPWVTDMPPWITYFVASARRSSYLADFLVFHEMIEPPEHLPDNVMPSGRAAARQRCRPRTLVTDAPIGPLHRPRRRWPVAAHRAPPRRRARYARPQRIAAYPLPPLHARQVAAAGRRVQARLRHDF